MTDALSQSALREWRDQFRQPKVLVVLAAVGVTLAIVAPYGTDMSLRPLPRLGYWALVVAATYAAGSLVVTVLKGLLPPWGFALRMGLSGIAAGLAVAAVVLALNAGLLGYVPERSELPGLVSSITGVALVVTLTIGWLSQEDRPEPETTPAHPAILDRLPLEKRGALLALSVEDHYVRVQTTKGTEMLLMRLSDAIRETGDMAGAQVHRSHWVAFPAVQAARRDGDRAVLTLTGGTEIPVSRANLPKLKEAGLLPR